MLWQEWRPQPEAETIYKEIRSIAFLGGSTGQDGEGSRASEDVVSPGEGSELGIVGL